MPAELITLALMLAVFAAAVFWWKLPAGLALALSSVTGALAAGEGFPLRHLVEGMFGYLDAVLIIVTAMLYMKALEASGALGTICTMMVLALHRWPTALMIVIVLFVMFPGMLTGLSSACILTTGGLVAPALLAMGFPPVAAGSLVALSAVFGMIAPPINIPVMIIGGGVDMPYVGFELPLLLTVTPPALCTALYFRFRYVRKIDVEQVLGRLPRPVYGQHGPKLFLPLAVVLGLMLAVRLAPQWLPDPGVPLIFILGALTAIGTGEPVRPLQLARVAVREALPVMAILVGVGMFVQIITLTGVRGFIAVSALKLTPALLYAGIAVAMPAFGSAYAASSVLGVPLVYVFLGRNELVVTSALSLIAGIGDMMPPPSLLCVFAAQLVGEKNHYRILRESLPMIVLTVLTAIALIMFAGQVGSFLRY
jgi:TRAP-type C4-dicarboxylate transport system permease large subunit